MTVTNPMISVITVTKNDLNGLNHTRASLLRQRTQNFEWIVLDGDSQDGTRSAYSKIASPNISFVSEPDKGLYFAMNKAILAARGDFIGILNADDTYSDHTLLEVERAIQAFPDADIFYGSITIDGKNDFIIHHSDLPMRMIYHPAVFIRKRVFREIGTFNTKYRIAADYDLLLRAYYANMKFHLLESQLADYRTGGISSKHVLRSIFETLTIQMRNPPRKYVGNLVLGIKSLMVFSIQVTRNVIASQLRAIISKWT